MASMDHNQWFMISCPGCCAAVVLTDEGLEIMILFQEGIQL
jgi:hypothetical protein